VVFLPCDSGLVAHFGVSGLKMYVQPQVIGSDTVVFLPDDSGLEAQFGDSASISASPGK